MDYGTRYTNRMRKVLEVRLRRIFTQAQSDVVKKLEGFTSRFEEKSKHMLELLDKGEITQEKYNRWLSGQVFMGAQWESKVKDVSNTLSVYYSQALDTIRDKQLDVFTLNANYQAYCLEHEIGKNFGFDLYSKRSVERLVKEQPELLPRKIINRRKHNFWNQGIINNCVTQGIIQGESIPQIAKRIANTTANHNNNAATMYARTAITSAQNGGRIEMLKEAKKKDIKVKKQWLATNDDRTRDAHADLDGQIRDIDEPFDSELGEIDYPGDPTAEPANVYNCRCTLVYVFPDYDDLDDFEDDPEVKQMSFEDWEEER